MLKIPSVDQKFSQLKDTWQSETAHLSSVESRCTHPAYRKIIGMGPAAVPLLLRELQTNPDHWFWALHAITCEDPIPEDIYGNVPAMANAWIEWGRQHDLI